MVTTMISALWIETTSHQFQGTLLKKTWAEMVRIEITMVLTKHKLENRK